MAFPDDPLDLTIELFYDSQWNDITPDVNSRAKVKITHGRPSNASSAEPSRCELELNNGTSKVDPSVSGRYSPENPESDLYGKLARNTPLRVRQGTKDAALELPGAYGEAEGSYVYAADHADFDITGDIDIQFDRVNPIGGWRPRAWQILGSKYDFTGVDERSWIVLIAGSDDPPSGFTAQDSGTLVFAWSTDGTFGNRSEIASTTPVPDGSGEIALRVTLDVDNGASGHDVEFYTADDADDFAGGASESQLGATVTTSGTTSIHSGTAPVVIGAQDDIASGDPFTDAANLRCTMKGFRLYSGIAGTLQGDVDFTDAESGDTSVTGSQSHVWTLAGAAAITDASVRFSGEVSDWPTESDVSGNDVWVRVVASGIRRRLGWSDKPLRSSLYRDLSVKPNIVFYVSCETGTDATIFPAAVGGGDLRAGGDVSPGAYSDLDASEALPAFNTGRLTGDIDPYTPDDDQRFMATVVVPSGGVANDLQLMVLSTTGSTETWILYIDEDGNVYVDAQDEDGTTVLASSKFTLDINGRTGLIWLLLKQNGSDIDWQVGFLERGEDTAVIGSGTLAGYTYGRATWVRFGTRNVSLNGLAAGHLSIMNGDVDSEFWDTAGSSLVAWSGETAADRILRLCVEEGVPLRLEGDLSTSEPMGPQLPGAFLTHLDECEKTDMGVLGDDRDALRLHYRTRALLHNRAAGLTIDYAAGEIQPPFRPVSDDQLTRNDVTVSRAKGSSHRAVLETGPLSVAEVGRYDVAPTVNLDHDNQLPDQAGFRLRKGTINQPRHPKLTFNVAATPTLEGEAKSLRPGDRVVIQNPPKWGNPNDHDQTVTRYTETMWQYEWTFELTLIPNALVVAEYGSAVRGPSDSELDSGITSSAASMDITTPSGPLWSTDSGDYPLDVFVGGERITITAMGAATGTVQTATITRSVNGVTKSHSAGDAVTLAVPAIRALGRNTSAHDLTDGDVILGQDFPEPVSSEDDTNVTGFTDTSYTLGEDEVSHVFQAPTSGRVLTLWHARLESNGSGTRASVAVFVETGTEVGAGTEVVGADQGIAVETVDPASGGADSLASWMQYRLVEGLTPGAEYIASLKHTIHGTASSGDIFYRSLAVLPVP